MSALRDVVVYDRVPARGQVSVAQVERYLDRQGYRRSVLPSGDRRWVKGRVAGFVMTDNASERSIESDICSLALFEQRQPSAVLADIMREQA
jgi:hypothetical protein